MICESNDNTLEKLFEEASEHILSHHVSLGDSPGNPLLLRPHQMVPAPSSDFLLQKEWLSTASSPPRMLQGG